MHQDDPDLINEPVDEYNGQVIHYAVKHKNKKLLEYVLDTGSNINAQAGLKFNSVLHDAAEMQDWEICRILFGHGINDELRNNEGKLAIELCLTTKCKREFTKAKQKSKRHKEDPFHRHTHLKQQSLMIAGLDLNQISETTIRRYVKETDHSQNFIRRKKEEIADREMAITQFGEDTDIECDEIALMMQSMDLKKVWKNLTKRNKNADSITKQTEMAKMLFGLTVLCLRKKNPRSKKPPMDTIKMLTTLLVKELPKKKGRVVLEKEMFLKEFPTILFKIHDKLVATESIC